MNKTLTLTIDGRFLYYAFLAGGKKILQNQAEINRINVFPVKDKDTGTNLASTIRSVLDNIKPEKSYKKTVNNIAEAALTGARGNSGVIFAQFLYGISQETINKKVITLSEFADSIKNSIPYIYQAVANPVEGTMLTVIRDWSEYIFSKKAIILDFKKIFVDSFEILEKSLIETTSKLNILKQYNVVDAGAKGFVLFIEGIIEFIRSHRIKNFAVPSIEDISLIHTENVVDDNITFRFCAEAILRDIKTTKSDLQKLLCQYGDSVVIAGSDDLCRIHVHTNQLASLFDVLKDYGTITFQKVDDMIRQREASSNPKWKIALVTDSTCDLSEAIIDNYQINVVPLNINFGENHYLDKVTIKPEQFYNLLERSGKFPKTSQINERTFTNLYSHLASHYDAIISIHLTEQFSGTYQSSVKAAERIKKEFNIPVVVVDSKNISGALGLIVLRVARSIEEGWPIEAIEQSIKTWIDNSKIFVSVKNLKYMIRGGRVSRPKGFIANLFGIKPIVSMDSNGKSVLMGQTLSQVSNISKVMKHIKNISREKRIWEYIVLHAQNPEGAEIYKEKMFQLTGKNPVSVVDISPVIGMNAGIGSTAVSLLFE
jgi:DegV family protein with EDD domain